MNHNEYYSKIRCIRCHGENIESFYNTGDVVCTDCGEVLASRLIDNRLEEIVYAEDRELGNTLTRSSGLAESLGSDEICFITTNNANNDAMMSSLNRAKKYLSNPKEKMILGCLKDVNAACSRMHLIGNIKVSHFFPPFYMYILSYSFYFLFYLFLEKIWNCELTFLFVFCRLVPFFRFVSIRFVTSLETITYLSSENLSSYHCQRNVEQNIVCYFLESFCLTGKSILVLEVLLESAAYSLLSF